MTSLIDQQTRERKIQIFKSALRFQESAAGIVVQRIPGSYLYRILRPLILARVDAEENGRDPDRIDPRRFIPDGNDPLVNAIYNIDDIFSYCKSKSVDMLASAEGVAMEWKEDGAPGHGCMLLAWKTTFDNATKKLSAPQLVGAMTLHKFKPTVNFSTDRASLSDRDYDVLHGKTASGSNDIRNYFSRNTMYIDAMCAKGKSGVGKVLVLHALRWALMRKCTGLIALSFSKRALKSGEHPESYPIFTTFKFEKTIPRANFKVQMYGTWFFQSLDTIGFGNIMKEAVDICTRTGFTEKTEETLIWRCPN